MIEWILSSSVLTLLVVGLRYVLRGRVRPWVIGGLWLLVLLRLLIPGNILGTSAMSLLNVTKPVSAQLTQALPRENPDLRVGWKGPDEGLAGTVLETEETVIFGWDTAPGTVTVPSVEPGFDGAALARWIWIAGLCLTALWFLWTNLRFALRLRRMRQPLETDAPVPVWLAQGLSSSCLFGLFRPGIYLTPEGAQQPAREHVLAHELAHYRRGDNWQTLFWAAALALHWYNPLIWLAAALARRDRELSADESAIKRLGEAARAEYGRTLVAMAAHQGRPGDILRCATTMTGGKAGLLERVKAVAAAPRNRLITLFLLLLITAVAVGCTFTGAETTPEPETKTEAESGVPSLAMSEQEVLELLGGLKDRGQVLCVRKWAEGETVEFRNGDAIAQVLEALAKVEIEGEPFEDSAPGGQSLRLTIEYADGTVIELGFPELRVEIDGVADRYYYDTTIDGGDSMAALALIFAALPSENDAFTALFRAAEEAASWFSPHNDVCFDTGATPLMLGGKDYRPFAGRGITTMAEMESYLATLFTEEFAFALMTATDAEGELLFVEENGVLYRQAGASQTPWQDCSSTVTVEEEVEGSAALLVRWETAVWERGIEGVYAIEAVQDAEGNWRFADFYLPMEAALHAYEELALQPLRGLDFSFGEFLGEDGSVAFPLFRPDTTKESFFAETGVEWALYNARQHENVSRLPGDLVGDSLFTVEGVPVLCWAGFDQETGCVSHVVIQFRNDTRMLIDWQALEDAFQAAFGDLERQGSAYVSADGITSLHKEYRPLSVSDGQVGEDTPRYLSQIIIRYEVD